MEWTKYPEKKPDKKQWYILTIKDEKPDTYHLSNAYWDGSEFRRVNNRHGCIVAWMPCPEPFMD